MSAIEDLVRQRQAELAGDFPDEVVPVKITIRLDPEEIHVLDVVAQRLEMSRTGCATSLLQAAIREAMHVALSDEEAEELEVDMHFEKLERERQ